MEHCIIRKLNVFWKVRDIINFISAFVYLTEQTNIYLLTGKDISANIILNQLILIYIMHKTDNLASGYLRNPDGSVISP